MIYNLSYEQDRADFKERCNKLYQGKKVVELVEKFPNRSVPQNRYLHLLLGWVGSYLGDTLEDVKNNYFKVRVNPDIFLRDFVSSDGEHYKFIRSTSTLDTAEMTLAIDRFRDWSAQEHGLYLPTPSEGYIHFIERELSKKDEREFIVIPKD